MKRKLELDEGPTLALVDRPIKHPRIFVDHGFSSQTEDVAMDNDMSSEPNIVSASSTTESPIAYPQFNLYPFPSYDHTDVNMEEVTQSFSVSSADSRTNSNVSEDTKPTVGLLQPKSSFVHNNSNCSQIPRLRLACEAGLGGQRTLWTQCDQCGSIEMIGGSD